MDESRQFCGRTRRDFLWNTGAGFPAIALSGLLGDQFFAKATRAADGTPLGNPLAPKKPMGEAKAKSVIFCSCMAVPVTWTLSTTSPLSIRSMARPFR